LKAGDKVVPAAEGVPNGALRGGQENRVFPPRTGQSSRKGGGVWAKLQRGGFFREGKKGA